MNYSTNFALFSSVLLLASTLRAEEPPPEEVPIPSTVAEEYSKRLAPGEALLQRTSALFDDEDSGPIETDRDSFTPSARTAGFNRLIVEAAYTFLNNRGIPETSSFPELLFRYGYMNRLEFRLGYNYQVGSSGLGISSSFSEGFGPVVGVSNLHTVTYGFKVHIFDQNFLMPDSSVVVQGFTPFGDDIGDSQIAATYVFGWKFRNGWKWDTAIRYGTGSREFDQFNVWSPSSVVKVPIADCWAVHLEYFGFFSDGLAADFVQHYLSPGVHYLADTNLEIGLRLAWGLNDQSSRFGLNLGMGWRY